MSEPLSSASAGAVLYKLLIYLIGPTAAAIVVMFMSQPKSRREWFCAVISTVIFSTSLGAYLIGHYHLALHLPWDIRGQIIGGIYFVCGLPGWFLVRVISHTLERYSSKTPLEIYEELIDAHDHYKQLRHRRHAEQSIGENHDHESK
mgnify:CR=1 FL=1